MEYAIVLLPLLGSIISGFFGKRLGAKSCQILTSSFVSISAILSFFIFYDVLTQDYSSNKLIFNWISSGNFHVNWSIYIDPLTSVMLVVVSLISSIIHFYSIGYMDDDPHKARFMAYLSLFTFAMLTLVTADNFLQLYFGWEGVGLCSYLLIGFWYKKPSANTAAIKAFIVNRVGDFGFAIGIFLIFFFYGTVNYDEVFQQTPLLIQKQVIFLGIEFNLITLICLLLFLGAMGKSAQILLHTWLPDAMEGPTPVSALIHAATMVTAGLYMVARLSHLFVLAPFTMNVIAVVGATTAILAATIAITQTDIKRVLAYSTVSQLGYMFLAMGVGAFGAGVFHVMTHAFFKALLFLGSGSVILAIHHEQDMRKMGALKNKLPITYVTMLLGTLAISGIPFFSGFFSKDEILWKAFSSPFGSPWLWFVGFLTAGMTAFYMFRMIYLTFHGESRVDSHVAEHVRESPLSITLPLVILAALAVIGGFFGVPHVFHVIPNGIEVYFHDFFAQIPAGHGNVSTEWTLMILSVIFALFAWFMASRLYHSGFEIASGLRSKWEWAYQLSLNKWYVDELYNSLIIQPGRLLSTHLLWGLFDQNVIDRAVNTTGAVARSVGNTIRPLQNGLIQNYALIFTLGTFLILWYMT